MWLELSRMMKIADLLIEEGIKNSQQFSLLTYLLTYLKNRINLSRSSSKQLSLQFNVSSLLINKIKRTDLSVLWSRRSSKFIKIHWSEIENVIEELKNFIINVDYPFNSIEITNHINLKINKNNKSCIIRKLMIANSILLLKKLIQGKTL